MEEAGHVDHAVQDDVGLERPRRVRRAPQGVALKSQAGVSKWKWKFNYVFETKNSIELH